MLAGLTIVQVSDLHNEDFGDNYETLVDMIALAEPDIIAITGDLIDSNHTDVNSAMEFIRGVCGV